jgi:gluconolactonase
LANPNGLYDPAVGNPGSGIIGSMKRELPNNTYRWDPSGRLEIIISAEQDPRPNGLCFSPDYKTLYVMNSQIYAFDAQGRKLSNMHLFTDCMVDGVACHPDGMRTDRAGNLWVSSNAPLGYGGVTVWNPAGKLIGRVRLPEVCANLCFAGPKRDYLFMCAGQSVYMVRLNIQGAAPG